MKRILTSALLILGTLAFSLPAAAEQPNSVGHVGYVAVANQTRWQVSQWEHRRIRNEQWRQARRWRNTNGYRNYGQYRRTEVGNRRWRMTTQSYYRNGRRYTRTVRIHY